MREVESPLECRLAIGLREAPEDVLAVDAEIPGDRVGLGRLRIGGRWRLGEGRGSERGDRGQRGGVDGRMRFHVVWPLSMNGRLPGFSARPVPGAINVYLSEGWDMTPSRWPPLRRSERTIREQRLGALHAPGAKRAGGGRAGGSPVVGGCPTRFNTSFIALESTDAEFQDPR